jgi:hypothetical protein
MGVAGRKRVQEKFSVAPSLSVILPAIRKVLQQKKICDLPIEQIYDA